MVVTQSSAQGEVTSSMYLIALVHIYTKKKKNLLPKQDKYDAKAFTHLSTHINNIRKNHHRNYQNYHLTLVACRHKIPSESQH